MAYTNETKLYRFNEAYTAVAGATKEKSGTATLDMNDSNDEKYVFAVTVSTAGTVKVNGNHRANDLSFDGEANKTYYLALDSMNYKQLTGTNKGKVVFAGTFVGTVTAIVLP